MKVRVKTIDQKQFNIDVDDDENVQSIKSKIQTEQNNDPKLEPSISKLIWKGKILKNEQTVKDAGINEKGFFVIMPGKPVASSTPATPVQTTEVQESTTETVATTEGGDTVVDAEQAVIPPVQPNEPVVETTEAPAPTTPQVQVSDDLLANIVALGIPPEKARLALQVSQGNPDIAVELIMSGNLEKALVEAAATSQTVERAQTTPQHLSNTQSPVPSSNPLAYLANNPTFQQMLNVVRQNPQLLPQVMNQIQQSNPQLLSQIQNNHEAFLELLNQEGTTPAAQPTGGTQQQGRQQGETIQIEVTVQDKEAIQRLMALGVSELEAAQAYLACDRNEEQAANFLLDD